MRVGYYFRDIGQGAKICPILPCIERMFPIWGVFEGVLVHPRPTCESEVRFFPWNSTDDKSISSALDMQSICAVLLRGLRWLKSTCAYSEPKRIYFIFYCIDNKRVMN